MFTIFVCTFPCVRLDVLDGCQTSETLTRFTK
jgi:hypothetical protein